MDDEDHPKSDFTSPQEVGSARLDALPAEIITNVVVYLDLDTIKAFRSTSRALEKGSFGVFETYIRRRKVALDLDSLKNIITELREEGLARYMEKIVFTEEEPEEFAKILKLLGTTFALAKARGGSYSIDIQSKGSGLTVILLALQATALPLRKLRFYPDGGNCTAAIDSYRAINLEGLAPCLQTVREFGWSLTTDPKQVADESKRCENEGTLNITAIRQVLNMVQGVENLDLLWFKTYPRRRPEAIFFETCMDSVLAMSRLRECSLRGIYITERGLREFLRQTVATKITLRAIQLHAGNYRSVIDVITSGKFNHFILDDLYEFHINQYIVILFRVLGRLRFGYRSSYVGPSMISRQGEDVRIHLEYGLGMPGQEDDRTAQSRRSLSTAMYGSD